MAPPQTRVPSRALIHALRGILFTTSCSVILLAEERRRRLKLARTALDNARKLHTAKTRRRSVSLIEDRGSWDFVDQYGLPNTKRALDKHLRKSGNLDEISSHTGSEVPKPSSPELKRASARSERRPGLVDLGKGFLSLDSLRAVSSPVHHHLSIPTWEPPTARRWDSHAHISSATDDPVEQQALSGNVAQSEQDTGHSASIKYSRAKDRAMADESLQAHILPFTTQQAQQPAAYDDHLIEKLLTKLASSNCSSGEAADLVASIINHLTSLKDGMLMPKKLLKRSPLLLQAVMKHDPASVSTLTTILLSHCDDTLRLLTTAAVHSIEGNRPDVLITLMKYVSDNQSLKLANSSIPYRLLKRYNKRNCGFESLKQLFWMLEQAGSFQGQPEERRYEYSARRFMIQSAAEAEDHTFAQLQTEKLLQMDAARVETDITLHGKVIEDEARRGDWSSVSANIETLAKCADTQQGQLRSLLDKLVQIFSEQHSVEKVETLLCHFVELYKMKMERHWALYVVERYGLLCDAEGACEWLQFCHKSGLRLDDAFLRGFYHKCRYLWAFNSADLRDLEEGLRAAIPTIPKDWEFERLEAGFTRGQEKEVLEADATGSPPETPSPRARFTNTAQASAGSDMSARMRSYVRHGQWQEAFDLYNEVCSAGAKFSPARFRLAIQSRIKLDDGCTDEAATLIRQAMDKGHDVSQGMKALMLGQLAAGADPQDLLDEFIRMGVRIHDDVYNAAALSLQYDGDVVATERVCRMAAKENGRGDLGYNKHNFANLLFVYCCHARYQELETLVDNFTAQPQFWHGSPRCKSGVKYAMKMVGSKIDDNAEDEKFHEWALHTLDRAFIHVKQCRPTPENRTQLKKTVVSMVSTQSTPRKPELVKNHEASGHALPAIQSSGGQDGASSQETIAIVHDDHLREAIACT
ncbi:hypothetical protein HJFPF1_06290 [Paramyrothecium foliicola]|nr:hypothetical protein HJFPF1_06290 [Paramyrothecium foliicola]